MKWNLISRYMMDRKGMLLLYWFSCLSIIFFFYMTSNNKDFQYPVILALVPFLIFLLVDGARYYRFNRRLISNIEGNPLALSPSTNEQQYIDKLLQNISINNARGYQLLKEHHRENLYFLSHLLHHLKAPIAVIDILLADEKLEKEKISEQSKRIQQTVNQALDIVRTDAFENDLSIQPVDLISILQQCINEYKRECIQHSIFPKIVCELDEIYGVTDRKWCTVLFQQLLSNAIKYSSLKEGKKDLICKIERKEQKIIVSIQDQGIGIPPYDRDSIFQPFFTGENGRKLSSSSGIGLYICKKICHKLGHMISFTTEVNVGTTFHISIDASKTQTNLT